MKKMSLAILVSMSALAGAACAQESTMITTITDPAKIAEIEQRAQVIQQQQEAERAAAEAKPMHEQHMKKGHKSATKAKAKADAASQ